MSDPVRSINKQRRKLSTEVKPSLSSASNGADKNKIAKRHPVMSIEEVAEYLKLSVPTIYRMVRRGQLPGIKLGRQWRFRQADIYNLFVQNYIKKQHRD